MNPLHKLGVTCAAILASFALPIGAAAAEHLSISASDLRFYGDRFLLEGDGNVDVLLDHQFHITGQAFSMDMRLNRFVVAGDVHVTGPGGIDLKGAGFSDFFDSNRIYFVPVLDQPDRWTFENNDLTHPFVGREMPGDPFFLPDVAGSRVTVSAAHAEIEPMTYVKFSSARVLSLAGRLPVPSYVLNFSNNPDFRQNSLAGAIVDAAYDFGGNAHLLSTLHLRYDQINKTYASFEQHYVAPGGWLVGSVNPFTKDVKQYNLIGLGRLGGQDQAYGFFQAIATQHGFSSPVQLPAFVSLQFTHAMKQSFVQLTLNQNYQSLLAQPSTFYAPGNYYYYGDPSHAWVPNHPIRGMLTWQGMDHQVGRSPLVMRLSANVNWAHDVPYQFYSTGLQTFLGQNYNTIIGHTVDALIYTKPIRLQANTYLNVSFDKNRQWFSLPHYIDTNYLTASVSRTYGSKVAVYGGYTVYNYGDYYGAHQLDVYAPSYYVSPLDGRIYNGFSAFRGIATYRTAFGSVVFAPTPDFTLNLILKHNRDFPEPIPGVLGNPPFQALADVRFRIAAHATIDIQRGYNFNYPGQAWTPTFSIQVLP